MSAYRTVTNGEATRSGELFKIGQKRVMTKRKCIRPGIGYDSVYLEVGDVFTIKNIIFCINYETDIFLCCEFEKKINGHNCRASRGVGGGAWDENLLPKEGHGEYLTIKEAVKITEVITEEPAWEV